MRKHTDILQHCIEHRSATCRCKHVLAQRIEPSLLVHAAGAKMHSRACKHANRVGGGDPGKEPYRKVIVHTKNQDRKGMKNHAASNLT